MSSATTATTTATTTTEDPLPALEMESAPSTGPTVTAILNYLNPAFPADEELYYRRPVGTTLLPGQKRTNHDSVPHATPLFSVRGAEAEHTLDTAGFEFARMPTPAASIARIRAYDSVFIASTYYAEAAALLKRVTGADRVVVFDHLVRKKAAAVPPPLGEEESVQREPVQGVHLDDTREYAWALLRSQLAQLPDGGARVRRAQILNLWRPLVERVQDWPLAVMDARSLDMADAVPVTTFYPDPRNHRQLYSFKYNPRQRWCFLDGMRCDEALVFKCFDSREGVAPLAPHASFKDPRAGEDAEFRESIELRAWLLYEHGEDELKLPEEDPEDFRAKGLKWSNA